jgi:hypothetical protein
MKRLSRIVITAAVIVGVAAWASASTPSNVLNRLEVQKFVAADTPIANLSLASHFNGLAEQFFTDAARYDAMAVVYKANANRSATTTAADNCARWAAQARTWGLRARGLAQYHVDAAAGREATLPVGATVLQGGYGAPEPSPERLHHLALTARTRADHLVLREYYLTLAKKRAAEADNYLTIAISYRAGVRNGHYDPGFAYERLAKSARKEAREATQAADRHQVFANIG